MNVEQTKSIDKIEIRDQSGDPFTAVWNWMLDCPDLTGTEKLVWIALKSYAGCREIRPSVQTVARRASVSIRTAQRSIDVLSKKDLIRVERRSRPDGGFATNRYILLPSQRDIAGRGVGATVTPTPPGVMVTPTPGATMSPAQVSQWHQENIKLIKDKKPTPLSRLQPKKGPDGEGRPKEPIRPESPSSSSRVDASVVSEDDIKKLVSGTAFKNVGEQLLRAFIQKYGAEYVFGVLDVLIESYKKSGNSIKDPVAILVSKLFRGTNPPSDFVPYHERIEKERKAKEEAQLRRAAEINKQKAMDDNYKLKAAKFDALPEHEKEIWLNQAKSELSPVLRNIKYAVRSTAIELCNRGP